MRNILLLLLFIPLNSLACERLVDKATIQALMLGDRVDTVRINCKNNCVCVDGFSLSYNEANLWILDGDVLSFDVVKKSVKDSSLQQKKSDNELELLSMLALKTKLDDGTAKDPELIEILKHLLKDLR